MTTKTASLLGFTMLLSATMACGDSPPPPIDEIPEETTETEEPADYCRPIEGCEAPEPAHLDDAATLDGISASFIDQNGNAAEGVQTTVCGTNICSNPADSATDGLVAVDSSEIDSFENPRFNAGHNGYDYAKLSGLIPVSTGSHDFGTVRVIRLPSFADAVALAPGETASQGGVSLALADDAAIQHSCVEYPEESQRGLRAAVVDISTWTAEETPQIDATLGIEAIVATSPLGTHICPAAEMTFDNVNGYAPGTEVDIYLNGAKTFKHYAPYGEWAKISEGVVSADGATIVTKEGMGIASLGTFGIAPK